jgi:hypothetical protein
MDFDDNDQEARIDALFNHLVDEGALELISIDPDSHEPLYRVTPKCKEILPVLYEEFRNDLSDIIFDLWQRGIVEVRFGVDSDSDKVRLSVEGLKKFWDTYEELSDDQVRFVKRMIDDILTTEIMERNFSEDL